MPPVFQPLHSRHCFVYPSLALAAESFAQVHRSTHRQCVLVLGFLSVVIGAASLHYFESLHAGSLIPQAII